MPADPDQRTAALLITMGLGSPGICNCTVNCMPVNGLMILFTRHPLAEIFRTEPVWRNSSLYNKVLESDTENRGYFLVTIVALCAIPYGTIFTWVARKCSRRSRSGACISRNSTPNSKSNIHWTVAARMVMAGV